jgi:integrase
MIMAKARKLPSGNWRCEANYTNEEGKYVKKSFTADTKKEAELKAAQFLMEYEHAKKPENKTLYQLSNTFIENRSNLLSPSTIIGYKKIQKNAFQSIINVRLGFLTKEMYQSAVNEYAKGRSPKTVLSAHVFFNRILKDNNIFVGEGAILPQKQKHELSIPSSEEIKNFLEYTKGTRVHLLVLFSVYLGLRRSETVAIQWKDIDLVNKTVSITKARVKDEFGAWVEKTIKTYSGTRTLRLPDAIINALPTEGAPSSYIIDDSIDALESLYKRMMVKANFPYNFHSLRHYNASVMLQVGMPNRYAKERMGHATENMLVNVYQHTFKNKHEEYDEALEAFFNTLYKGEEDIEKEHE